MTSKEFKALKAELTRKACLIVIQRKPYTTVVAEIEHNGQRYIDFGFSKVNWPDWFLPSMGKNIAFGRAIHEIACRVELGLAPTADEREFYVDYVLSAPMSSPPPEDELRRWAFHPCSATASTGS